MTWSNSVAAVTKFWRRRSAQGGSKARNALLAATGHGCFRGRWRRPARSGPAPAYAVWARLPVVEIKGDALDERFEWQNHEGFAAGLAKRAVG